MNRTFRGVAYVSVWVVIWGTVASLMDWMLLTGEVYETASSGQAVTFIAYGAATVVLATRFSGLFLADAIQRLRIRSDPPISSAKISKAFLTRRLPFTRE